MKNDGGPAFPQVGYQEVTGNLGIMHIPHFKGGMSLRDWFAGMALGGWYTNGGMIPHTDHLKTYAENFYKMADAMLAERDKKD